MIFTIHFLLGAVLATKIKTIALFVPLAFISHYILDAIPHKQYSLDNIFQKNWKNSFFDFLKIFLDVLLGILLVFILAQNLFLALLGGIFATLPDGFTFLSIIFQKNKILKKHFNFHHKTIHSSNKKISIFWRIFIQILIGILAIIFLRQS
ncbi:MAG TPA: hypothetical protein ENH06_01415 [bacterium]|nr:hypothetical protein [bacterium]